MGGVEIADAFLRGEFVLTKVAQAVQKLFTHVTGLNFPGLPAFNINDFFTKKNTKVKFYDIGSNFKSWFGDMEVATTEAQKLSLDRLKQNSYDPDIIKEIGDENCNQSLAVIRWHIESGQANKGSWYGGYFLDKSGSRRAVYWDWDVGGWGVYAFEVPSSDRWNVGREFVSRKPLVA